MAYRGHLHRIGFSRGAPFRRNVAMGDGFLKNVFKGISKLQPGKALAKVATKVALPIASSLPGVGSIVKIGSGFIGKMLNTSKQLGIGGLPGVPFLGKLDLSAGTLSPYGAAQDMASLAGSAASSASTQGIGPTQPTGAKTMAGPAERWWRGAHMNPDGTWSGRRRRTNPLNPRALRRSISRLRQFERFAKSALVVHNFRSVGKLRVGHRRPK